MVMLDDDIRRGPFRPTQEVFLIKVGPLPDQAQPRP